MRNTKKDPLFWGKLPKRIQPNLRWLLLLIFIFSLPKNVNANAQKQKVSLTMTGVSVVDVLNQIETLTDARFIYNPEKINIKRKVSITAKNKFLSTVLQGIFENTKVGYTFSGNYIILKLKDKLQAQKVLTTVKVQRTISGTVTDEGGQPLPGASVIIKGTTTGTTTNFDGLYKIDADTGDVLIISYIGYTNTEVTVGAVDTIDVKLESSGLELQEVSLIGSRTKPRTNVDAPVPIDVISIAELQQTAQIDVGQSLQFSVPSFNAVKFGINDLAPLVDPASLRGLAPDQTLLLVNGKRRHKVSFFSLNDGIGKGQLGNDINAIPSGAIKQVEVLRDGAAAQYGSDAIAGVVNMQLKNNSSGGSIRTYYGTAFSNPTYDDMGDNANLDGENIYDSRQDDGETFSTEINFGLPWGEDGFISTTLNIFNQDFSDRSGLYQHSSGYYTDEQLAVAGLTNDQLLAQRGINLDRAILGTAKNTNGGVFINAGKSINENWDFYAFGGLTFKEIVGGVFTRSPNRTSRSNTNIFFDGYNPEVPSNLTDFHLTAGFKGDLGKDWNFDFSGGYSGNILNLFARNTINPSLGDDSPTQFFTGGLGVTQTLFNVDFTKPLGENTTLALGAETRFETFEQIQGDVESWIAGPLALLDGKDVGSSGREGFRPESDGKWERSNTGIYAEIESDISESFLVGGAIRFENYSDFGSDFSYKVASRYKFSDAFSLRGSFNRSFRAPALAQDNYSNFSQIAFDNDGNSVVTPFLPTRDSRVRSAFGIDGLEQETSNDLALGITSQLGQKLSMTLDVYQINLKDRILVAGFEASKFPVFNNSGFDEINIFTNALDTKTTGLDFVASYKDRISENQSFSLSFAANLNETKVEGFNLPSGLEEGDISSRDIDYLTRGTPQSKMILTGDYKIDVIGFLVRFTRFGEVFDPRATFDDANGEEQAQTFSAKVLTDFSITGHISKQITLTASANNLFDVYPDMLINPQTRNEVIYSRRTNQFGTIGRFLSLSLQYKW